jgi:hypothetical protein
MTHKYNLNEFPDLNIFLNRNYNISKVHASDTYKISDEGNLCKMTDDYMFISYDVWEYNADNQNAFYEDFNRSAVEPSSYCNNKVSDNDFEQYAFAVSRQIKRKVIKKHEEKCMKFLKIIYDYPKRLSVPVAAMCVNQMFNTKLNTTMLKYDNKSKTKLILQKLREQFSLLN